MEKYDKSLNRARSGSGGLEEGAFPSATTTTTTTPGGALIETEAASAMPVQRWENRHTRRYYEALVQQDLFGNWEVWKRWGGLCSPRGGQLRVPVPGRGAGLAELADTGRRRGSRGYLTVRAPDGSQSRHNGSVATS